MAGAPAPPLPPPWWGLVAASNGPKEASPVGAPPPTGTEIRSPSSAPVGPYDSSPVVALMPVFWMITCSRPSTTWTSAGPVAPGSPVPAPIDGSPVTTWVTVPDGDTLATPPVLVEHDTSV